MRLSDESVRGRLSSGVIYHGSREGIRGPIAPLSRPVCDFGRGFYMGTNLMQASSLIAAFPSPVLYTLKLDVSRISDENVVVLNDREWLYTVLGFRTGHGDLADCPPIRRAVQRAEAADLVIGPIADDRMVQAMKEFENGAMTDRALMACLRDVDYGFQIVAKSQRACDCIQITEFHALSSAERADAARFGDEKHMEGSDSIRRARERYPREGLFIHELIRGLRDES